jgi:ribosomal-protein-alanine N-acetyltransferase
MTILETERLRLRRLEPADLDELARLYADPDVRRYFPEGTLTREETWEELEWFLDGHPEHPELGLWAAIHKPSGRFIGRCGLLPWTIEGREEVEVAYLLARKYWGQGLGSEIARALVRYGFATLGLKRLISLIDPLNEPSKRTALSAGLAFERVIVLDDMRYQVYAIANPAIR